MRTVHLPDREQMRNVDRFVPDVPGQPAVVVLGADRDLEHFAADVDIVVAVELDRARIHRLQPFDLGAEAGAGFFEILPRLAGQLCEVEPGGVRAEVQKDPPPPADRLLVHQQIDLRRAVRHLAHIERPLVALEKDHRIHRIRIFVMVEQEFALVRNAVRRGRDETRQHLHVGAGDVPAEARRSESELRLRQILRRRADLERKPDAAHVSGRIDARGVEPARAADREHGVLGEVRFELLRLPVPDDRSGRAAVDGDELRSVALLGDLDPGRFHRPDQRETHLARGVRPAARRAPFRVVVGLVADVLAEFVAGERHAEVHEIHEAAHRHRGLDQRHIAVHRAAVEERPAEQRGRIRLGAVDAELVVGLLVAAGVDRSAAVQPFGEQQHIVHAERLEPERRRESRRAGADHQCVDRPFHSRPISMPPSTLITCPVE